MALVCLLVGISVGYLLRGSESPGKVAAGPATQMAPPMSPPMVSAPPPGSPMGAAVTPEQLKMMVEKQVEPKLQQLKAEPNNASLLANVGDVYYDGQQYRDAVTYYDRSLKLQPGNTSVRTDMGTAYWYLGDADRAIREFQTVLKTEPTKANTLLNLGVVEWQGKMDAAAAIAAWQKLLDSNPNYENKEQVQQMIAQARKHMNMKPGSKTGKPGA